MGIFEKSIPKYAYNYANELTVQPQDVYVDDIFDPILNANVQRALREKYGGGLFGTLGGYGELLQNAWEGDGGIFGAGMGVLSTFGRSMEKADDIILGGLTETVKGLSGQGFENPLENIFVNDQDYSGRRFLAAAANVASPFMGGAKVDESDFGAAWTLPALGIELGTDVGILGGSVAKKLAPHAAKFTSKELFENLGKRGAKSAVGEVGQLLSNYDDFMAKVAIDVTAPGLRPAFKALKSKFFSATGATSEAAMENVVLASIVNDPGQPRGRRFKAKKKLMENENVQSVTKLVDDAETALANAPEEPIAEAVEDTVLNQTDEIAVVENANAARLDEIIKAVHNPLDGSDEEFLKALTDEERALTEAINTRNTAVTQAVQDYLNKAGVKGAPAQPSQAPDNLLVGPKPQKTDSLTTRQRLIKQTLNSYDTFAFADDDLHFTRSKKAMERAGEDTVYWNLFKDVPEEQRYNRLMEFVNKYADDSKKAGADVSIDDRVFDAANLDLSDSSFILRDWSVPGGLGNPNSVIEHALRYANDGVPYVSKEARPKPKFSVSPSEYASYTPEILQRGARYTRLRLSKAFKEASSSKLKGFDKIRSKEELVDLLNRPRYTGFLSRMFKDSPESVDRFKELLSNVMFPANDYTYRSFRDDLKELTSIVKSRSDASGIKTLATNANAARMLSDDALVAAWNNPLKTLEPTLRSSPKLLPHPPHWNRAEYVDTVFHIIKNPEEMQYLDPAIQREISQSLKDYENVVARFKRGLAQDSVQPEYEFLDDVVDALDDVSAKFLRPADWQFDYEGAPLITKSTTVELDDGAVGERAGLTSNFDEAKAVLHKKQSDNKLKQEASYDLSHSISDVINSQEFSSVEEFEEFVKPLTQWFQIKYKPSEILKGTVSDQAFDTFRKEVLPLIQERHSKGFGVYTGLDKAKDPASMKLKELLGQGLKDYERTPMQKDLRQLVRYVVNNSDTSFALSKEGVETDFAKRLTKKPFRSVAAVDEAKVLLDKAPSEVAKALQALNPQLYKRFVDELSSAGFTLPKLDELYSRKASANIRERANLDAYWQIVSKHISTVEAGAFGGKTFTNAQLYKTAPWRAELTRRAKDIAHSGMWYTLYKGKRYTINANTLKRFGPEWILRNARRDVNGKTYSALLEWVDYTKLFDNARQDTVAHVASKHLSMPKFEDAVMAVDDAHEKLIRVSNTPKLKSSKLEEAVSEAKETIIQQPSESLVKMVDAPTSPNATVFEKTIEEAIPEAKSWKQRYTNLKRRGINPKRIPPPPNGVDPRKWELFVHNMEAQAVRTRVVKGERPSLNRTRSKAVLDSIDAYRKKYGDKQGRQLTESYVKMLDYVKGDTLKASEFVTELQREGLLISRYSNTSHHLKTVREQLKDNVAKVNEVLGENALIYEERTADNFVDIYVRWNTADKQIVVKNAKLHKKLAQLELKDVVFSPARKLTPAQQASFKGAQFDELQDIMRQIDEIQKDQARTLGFDYGDVFHVKHTLKKDKVSASYVANHLYKDIDTDALDEISFGIANSAPYRTANIGMFGTREQGRRFRGDYWLFGSGNASVFTFDPLYIAKSSIADGIFSNTNYQVFVDVFENDNFKIKEFAPDVETLEKILYVKDGKGSFIGNLYNMELVAAKYNESGKLVGFTKFDKTSKAGLEKALANPDTVLLPSTAFSHLDNVVRKNMRMGNKALTFINKYITFPYKISVLCNPGFLLGNLGDAYVKQAATLAKKYGTTIAEESKNVADSMKAVIHMKNAYSTVFERFVKSVKEAELDIPPMALVPDVAASNPKYGKYFSDWMNGKLEGALPDIRSTDEAVSVLYWNILSSLQNSSKNLREFEDVAEMMNKSEFDVPTNIVERILRGSGKYDPKKFSSWGLVFNNPVGNAFSKGSSHIEEIMRSSAILNDLRHQGIDFDDLRKYFKEGADDGIPKQHLAQMLDDALNVSNAANFDYERVNDFIDGMSKVVPFPIFFLKNFAFWMDLFMEHPQWVDNTIDVQEGLWAHRKESDKDNEFAIQAKGRGAIPIGGETLPGWFKGIYKPTPLQSMFTAFNLLNDPLGNVSYRLHPALSGGVAMAGQAFPNELTTSIADPESTKYRPYSTNVYERNVSLDDPNFNVLEYATHRMNPYERATNTYLRTPSKIAKGDAQLSDFLPSMFQPDF